MDLDVYSGDVYLASYIGPPDSLWDALSHYSVCAATWSGVSHTELVIDGLCYSSSMRDKYVRSKEIDLNSGRWLLQKTNVSKEIPLAFFEHTKGLRYDWAGAARYVIPSLPNSPNRWYCSEWCSGGLGYKNTDVSPYALHCRVKADNLVSLT